MTTAIRFRSALLALPGQTYGQRVFAKKAPDDLAGAVWLVIDRVSNIRLAAHDGDGRMSDTLFQVTVGGGGRDQVEAVKDFLLENLNGHTYTDATGSISVLHDGDADDFDSDTGVYASFITFRVLDNNT